MNIKTKRLLAYCIDMLVVSLIVTCLTSNSIINKHINEYNKYYKDYQEKYTNYTEVLIDLNDYYKDNKITTEEYNKLIKKHQDYEKQINKYYQNNSISKKDYNKLIKEINNDFSKEYKTINYNLSKYSIAYNIVYIIVIIAYFVFFNVITEGRTLGKKITRLKVVNSTDFNNKVNIVNYLVRAIILYNPLYYLLKTIGTYCFNVQDYYNFTFILTNFQNYLLLLIVIMIVIRRDNRGLHEVLSQTRVVELDKTGKIITPNLEIPKKELKLHKKLKNKKIVIDNNED